MPYNGEPDDTLEELLENLRFPSTFSEEECEAYRENFREHPENLNSYVDVQDLYGFIMGMSGPRQDTKEYFRKALEYYLGDQEMAYSVMVGLYVQEAYEVLKPRLKDDAGCQMLKERILKGYYIITLPPDHTVH